MNTQKGHKKLWWLLVFGLLLFVVVILFSIPTAEQAAGAVDLPTYTVMKPSQPSVGHKMIFLRDPQDKWSITMVNANENKLHLLRVMSGSNVGSKPTGYFTVLPGDTIRCKENSVCVSFFVYDEQHKQIGWVGDFKIR